MKSKPVIFLGDAHLSDRQIKTRVDNTVETCLEKFAWVIDYAKRIGADVIHTGDFVPCVIFNTKFRYDIKVILRDAREAGVQFYSISGNHDVSGADFSELPHRELGQLCLDGYMKFLGSMGESSELFFVENDRNRHGMYDGVVLGYSAYSKVSCPEGYGEKVVGLVCHHWIGDAFGDALVVYPDEVKKIFPNLEFIVAGHDHAFHDSYISRDGVLVVRPGSMMRTDSGKSSDRIPCFAVWNPGLGYVAEAWAYRGIECARPYGEVFYAERKEIDKESVGVLDAFVKRMNQNVGVIMDVNSVIKMQFDLLPEVDKSFVRQDLVANGFMV
jgi:predicted phosphodiesterase